MENTVTFIVDQTGAHVLDFSMDDHCEGMKFDRFLPLVLIDGGSFEEGLQGHLIPCFGSHADEPYLLITDESQKWRVSPKLDVGFDPVDATPRSPQRARHEIRNEGDDAELLLDLGPPVWLQSPEPPELFESLREFDWSYIGRLRSWRVATWSYIYYSATSKQIYVSVQSS